VAKRKRTCNPTECYTTKTNIGRSKKIYNPTNSVHGTRLSIGEMMIERQNFLHNHDHLQQNPAHEHVVVDRSDWEKARKIFFSAESQEDARAKLAEQTKSFEFIVVLIDGTVITDEIAGQIYQACDDCLITTSGSRAWLRFTREAETLEQAINSAVADIHKAKCVIPKTVEIEVVDLVYS
jgi:DNA-dependent RNA polymerase auxiliary subunit epsilon